MENGKVIGAATTTVQVSESEATPAKVSGQLSFNHHDNGDFDIIVANVSSPNSIKEVQMPVWSSKSNQDGLKWYRASQQAEGSYKVSVKISDHKGDRDRYNAHLYYVETSGKTVGLAASQTTVSQPIADTRTLAAQGQYTFQKEVAVRNQASLAAKVEFIFTKGERIRYDKVLIVEGKTWIAYKSYSGLRRYIAIN
ncbi:hypothetical protein D3X11_03190 [Streptococcus sp. X16XC17]|uniref:GBS Bsp-like repeat-containing protein n=1 Tax=unclassified Streptococcus TaxID=2608887 RepID=UPI00066FB80A|nr:MULTISPECIES: GBS Bsp-like repeat-containing protein [unclassified Streptococcus]TCD46430.1 hypothetical protein D3X11_03190 [Streptococcus sp. X16XC17]